MKLANLPSDKNPIVEIEPTHPFHLMGLRGKLRHHESMSKHTSWRVGGPAQWFYEPADLIDLSQFMGRIPHNMPIFWLGLGSNLLVREGGILGLVIRTAGLLKIIEQLDPTTLYVQAGVSCAKVARFAAQAGLTGTEFLAGIPGTMGGALATNAGAWGQETWSLVHSVETIDQYGQQHYRTPKDYQIGYRQVAGPQNEWFITTRLQLMPSSVTHCQAEIKHLLQQRRERQPIGLPSCGSVFRNPPNDYAARLIEAAGWKGQRCGGAVVSEKHANFIINYNQATAIDIENLMEQILISVEQSYGIRLIPEVQIVGIDH